MADADEDDDDDDVVAAVAAIALTASETYVFSAIASSTHATHGINSIDLTNKSFAEEQLLQRLRGLSICHFSFQQSTHKHAHLLSTRHTSIISTRLQIVLSEN